MHLSNENPYASGKRATSNRNWRSITPETTIVRHPGKTWSPMNGIWLFQGTTGADIPRGHFCDRFVLQRVPLLFIIPPRFHHYSCPVHRCQKANYWRSASIIVIPWHPKSPPFHATSRSLLYFCEARWQSRIRRGQEGGTIDEPISLFLLASLSPRAYL